MSHSKKSRRWGWKHYTAALIAVSSVLMSVSSCTEPASTTAPADIITQKGVMENRIPVTVLVKYAFSINTFEKAVEEKFPEIDIIQVGNYTHEMGIDEYAARMEHGDLTDIVMTWPLEAGEEYCEDRLIDLSGMEFTSRYNLSMLNSISKNGKLYYLPGPSQIRGIVYNKTLFEEKGWKVPSDFEGFVNLCKTIEASGMRSIQLPFGNSEVFDTAFTGYGYSDCFSKPEDNRWIADYNDGKGSFGDHFSPALDTFQKMIDEGIWKKSDLDIRYPQRETMLFTRQCAMVEDSVLMARMGQSQTGTTDEYALMPFFNPGQESDWARLYMVCYIGLNKHLLEPENKEKYDLILKLMDYISTPEGQATLAGDTGAMFSSLKGTSLFGIPEVNDMRPALEQGRYAIFPTLKNAQSALRSGLAGMLSGTLTKQDVIQMVDEQNATFNSQTPSEVIGSAASDFTLIETGNFITDAMRKKCDSDIALFMDNGKDGRYNGKGVSGRIYKGDVTEKDIGRIMPDLKHGETGTMWKITMTGQDLLTTIEKAIPVDNNITGWFYYFSGLRMEFNPLAEPGSRIKKITTSDGQEIDPQKMYSIAVMDETVPQAFIKSCEKTGILISDIIKQEVQEKGTISPSTDGRFTILSK